MSLSIPMVTLCICRNVTFATAREHALRTGSHNVEELQRHIDVSTGCGLCIPYLQRAIETCADAIPLMPDEETAPYRARAGDVRTRENGSGR